MSTQNNILTVLKYNLGLNTNIKFVGDYPDDVAKVGRRFPAVLIKDADENVELNAGRSEEYQWFVTLYIYHNNTATRIPTMNTITNSVIDTVLNDLHQDGTAVNTILEEVIKGDYDDTREDRYNAGYYPNLTVRELKFRIDYCRSRPFIQMYQPFYVINDGGTYDILYVVDAPGTGTEQFESEI